MAILRPKVFQPIIEPFQRFFSIEASSGIMLIVATAVALIWANSSWSDIYFDILNRDLKIQFGSVFNLSKPLIYWINDGLMAIFFFVVGLEIKREILIGELSSLKQASLPVIAALGGMILPASLFVLFHHTEAGREGWGIPMATDIAFSLGILSLLGKRVPLSLKIFLTAFAIVDDLGAVFVIAIFYSGQIYWNMLFIGLGFFAVLGLMIFFGLRSRWVFIIAGGIIWYYFLKSGVHPTISGVMLAMIVPAGRRIRVPAFSRLMRKNLDAFCDDECEDQLILTKSQLRALDDIEEYVRHVQSPLQTLEHRMHGFVSYIIMPVFALANAGIILSAGEGPGLFGSLTFDIALALLLGKLFGILGFSWLGVKFKLGALPEGIRWVHITGLALLGGIGFTMSLFIASMAYLDPIILNQAKIGIILGSMVAGIGGYLLLRYTLKYNL